MLFFIKNEEVSYIFFFKFFFLDTFLEASLKIGIARDFEKREMVIDQCATFILEQ